MRNERISGFRLRFALMQCVPLRPQRYLVDHVTQARFKQ